MQPKQKASTQHYAIHNIIVSTGSVAHEIHTWSNSKGKSNIYTLHTVLFSNDK